MKELVIALNPDEGSTLGYLMLVPLGDGMVLRTSGTWPRTKALYCYPVPKDHWPQAPEIVERVLLRSCARRGAAVDLVAARSRENRSQLVFTKARGRDAVFWQSPRTRKQARPAVTLPTARASGIDDLEIVVDSHEHYAYRFAGKPVRTVKRALPCGDYGIVEDGRVVAAVERKSLADLVSSLTTGRLRYALGELSTLPRAAVVVEDRYSQVYRQDRVHVRPALIADGLAECQVRWPDVPIGFFETRSLAEEWTYRYLAAAHVWAADEPAAIQRIEGAPILTMSSELPTSGCLSSSSSAFDDTERSPSSPAAIRSWARENGLAVPDRGRIPTSIRREWELSRGSN